MREITQQAGDLLQLTNIDEMNLANSINEVQKTYQKDLKMTSLITKKIKAIGTEEGILASKLIGPNWGRMMLLYAPDSSKRIQTRIRNDLKLRTFPIKISNKGITIQVT